MLSLLKSINYIKYTYQSRMKNIIPCLKVTLKLQFRFLKSIKIIQELQVYFVEINFNYLIPVVIFNIICLIK